MRGEAENAGNLRRKAIPEGCYHLARDVTNQRTKPYQKARSARADAGSDGFSLKNLGNQAAERPRITDRPIVILEPQRQQDIEVSEVYLRERERERGEKERAYWW